jgi:hypothetical protein
MTAEKRLVRVTAAPAFGAVSRPRRHLYVTGLGDFFPPEAFGGARRKHGAGGGIELILDGLGETVVTDIGSEAKSGFRESARQTAVQIGKCRDMPSNHAFRFQTLSASSRLCTASLNRGTDVPSG